MENQRLTENQIILYQPDSTVRIEVRLEDDTVWLTQAQMMELFCSTKQNISLHISNIFKEKELTTSSTVKESLTVQMEGKRKVKRRITYYNLDVIISVGYRVKSQRGTDFFQKSGTQKIVLNGKMQGGRYRMRGSVLKYVTELSYSAQRSRLPFKTIFYLSCVETLACAAATLARGTR